MNYLELVRLLASECGVTSTAANIQAVTNQVGESARLVGWIRDAWLAIQGKHPDWKFMRKSFSFATVNEQATYTPVQAGISTGHSSWLRDSMRCYTTSLNFADEMPLEFVQYDDWRDDYQMGSSRFVYSRPVEVSIAPDRKLCLGPVPIAGYTIIGDYYRGLQTLTADGDEPDMPEQFHLAIVEKARISYGLYMAAEEQVVAGKSNYNELLRQLVNDQLPEVRIG